MLKAGGAYVPLDPAFPADRLSFMIADSAMRVILTQRDLQAALPDGAEKVLVEPSEQAASAASAAPAAPASGRRIWPTSSTPPDRRAVPRAS